MCATTGATMPRNNSTWAASVPIDLTETITAAVGAQPVPQLPPKHAVVPTGPSALDTAQLPSPQQLPSPTSNTKSQSISIRVCATDVVPMRRPTLAEVQAASPAEGGLRQQVLEAEAADAGLPGIQDSMQHAGQGHQDYHVQQVQAAVSDAVVVTNVQATQLSQQQQQQLLSQLWTELQAPPAKAAAASGSSQAPHAQQLPQLLQPSGSVHMSMSDGSLQTSSSCSSSSDQVMLAAAALAAAAAATPAGSPDSPCSSSQSKALSTCSTSSSKKRVSWGDDVVYQLPPDEPTTLLSSLWQQLSAAWTATHKHQWHWTAAGANTATVVVSLAAVAVVGACIAHKARSS